MLQNYAERYSTVVKEIDELVDSNVTAVQVSSSEQLLQYAVVN